MAKLLLVILCFYLCGDLVLCQFGFFSQDESRPSFQFGRNFDPRRIIDKWTAILHLSPEPPNSNPEYVYPFNGNQRYPNNRPSFGQYDRPMYPFQNEQNNPNNFNQYNNRPSRPVVFPEDYIYYIMNSNQYPNINQYQPGLNIPQPNEPNQYDPQNNMNSNQNQFDINDQPNQVNLPPTQIDNQPILIPQVDTTVIPNINNEQNQNNARENLFNNGEAEKPNNFQPIPINTQVDKYQPNLDTPQSDRNPPIQPTKENLEVIFNQPSEANYQSTQINTNDQGNNYNNLPNQKDGEKTTKAPRSLDSESTEHNVNNQNGFINFGESNGFNSNNQNGFNNNPNGGAVQFGNAEATFPSLISTSDNETITTSTLPPLTPVSASNYGFNNGFSSTLPPLTPVVKSSDNINFGTGGIFSETCETIDQDIGSCISLYECPLYLNVIKESRNNPEAVTLLRKVHCGFEGNNPKVCCPRPGFPVNPPTEPTTTTTTSTTTPAPTPEPQSKSIDPDDFIPALPEPPICGISNASFSRVVGGIDAKLGDFPWMALLGYKGKRNPETRWLCGGCLISSKHTLTAAHCIHGNEDSLYLVRLGELDLARDDEGATPTDILIKKKFKHEGYSANSYVNDIGILVLAKEVEFTYLIRPICLPKDNELRARSFENYNPLVAGWGSIEFRGPSATILQIVQLPVVGNDFCTKVYAPYKAQVIDDRVLCAGYKQGGKDACQGDSGGPLMQPIWNSEEYTTYFYQIGVVSYGKKCAEAGFPGVYSRVTKFMPWIEEKVLGTS